MSAASSPVPLALILTLTTVTSWEPAVRVNCKTGTLVEPGLTVESDGGLGPTVTVRSPADMVIVAPVMVPPDGWVALPPTVAFTSVSTFWMDAVKVPLALALKSYVSSQDSVVFEKIILLQEMVTVPLSAA